MRIISWNVNGIRAIWKKGFLDWMKEESPEILCLQETKIQLDQLTDEMKDVEGYHSFFHQAEKKGYSGTAIYTKEEPIRVWRGLLDEEFNHEGRTLIAEYSSFILMNIYFPNGQMNDDRLAFKMRFYDALMAYADELVASGKKLIICGDYNTAHTENDIKNAKSNEKRSGFLPIERAWIDTFIEHGYVDAWRRLKPEEVKYSWWSYRFSARKNNTGWRIDYHFVSENLFENVTGAEIHNDVLGSDHCPISIDLSF